MKKKGLKEPEELLFETRAMAAVSGKRYFLSCERGAATY